MTKPRTTPPAAPAVENERDDVADLLAALGDTGGYRVRVERRDARGDGGDYLGTIDLTADLLDDVKEKFGGGKYRGRVVDNKGAYKRNISFGIAGAPKVDPALAPAPASDDPRLAAIEKTLGTLTDVVATLAKPAAPAVAAPADPLAQFAAMAKIIASLRPEPAAPVAPATTFADQLQTFVAVGDLIDKRGGRGGGSSLDVAALVKDGLTPLVQVVSKKLDIDSRALALKEQRAGAPAAPLAPALAPVAGAVPAIHPATDVDVKTLTLTALLARVPNMARAWLANCADNDLDATLYADVVLDALPADTHAALPRLLTAPDALDETARAVPEWARPARLAWVRDLYAAIVDNLTNGDDVGGAGGEHVPGAVTDAAKAVA